MYFNIFVFVLVFLHNHYDAADVGEPLILTTLIERGQLEEARTKSAVDPCLFDGVKSYSGFFTVNKQFNSNQFFWYFPSKGPNGKTNPVLLWLQGGPGRSAIPIIFNVIGPIIITDSGFIKREYDWTLTHNILIIENPTGTGFSFTDGGYARNQTIIGSELYSAIYQFFTIFPELQKNDFYIGGASYAGKFVPTLSYTIHEKNKHARLKINLRGLLIGNGLCDPINQLDYGKYYYQLGLVDTNGRAVFESYEKRIAQFIILRQNGAAYTLIDELFGKFQVTNPLFSQITGYTFTFNVRYATGALYLSDIPNGASAALYFFLLQRPDIRKAIHVGDTLFNDYNPTVQSNLLDDYVESVAPLISLLLSNYRVLIYNGQMDLVFPYPLTENYLRKLHFSEAHEYRTAKRKIWRVDNDIAGYVKSAGNLQEVLVRNAGHSVEVDQPKWAFGLVSNFTSGKPLNAI